MTLRKFTAIFPGKAVVPVAHLWLERLPLSYQTDTVPTERKTHRKQPTGETAVRHGEENATGSVA